MIQFRLEPKAEWIPGDEPLFDQTELGLHSKEERKQIQFLIFPYTSSVIQTAQIAADLLGPDASEAARANRFSEEVLDNVLLDWDGVVSENGERIPCTRENKLKLVNGHYIKLGEAFINVAAAIRKQYDRYNDHEDDRLKNGLSSQNGTPEG